MRPVTEKLFNFYDDAKSSRKRRSSKTKKSTPKNTQSDELPSINEENEDEDDKPRTIRRKAITLGTQGVQGGSEAFRRIEMDEKGPENQVKRSLSLPSNRQLEKMYSQSGPIKLDSLKRSDSLTEI